MKFDRNSIGVIRRYIGTGSPGGKSWDAKKPPTPCLPMPAPMKVTYVMRAKNIGTATTDEAAMLMPGMMPAMFMDRTPKKRKAMKPENLRPVFGPSMSRATLSRM